MDNLNDKFSDTDKIKRQSRIKQTVTNYVFIVFGIVYFLIINYFFDAIFTEKEQRIKSLEKQYKDGGSTNQHLAEKIRKLKQSNEDYENDTIAKNYTFKRPFQVLFRNMQSHAIQLTLFLFFIAFCIFLYIKYNLTDERDLLLNPQKTKENSDTRIKTWIDTILNSLNSKNVNDVKTKYDNEISSNLMVTYVVLFMIISLTILLMSRLAIFTVKFLFTIQTFATIFAFLMNGLIILIGVGSIWRLFKKSENLQAKVKGTKLVILYKLLEATILYIPCIISDLIAYSTNSVNNTKKYVFIVLLIEIVLLLMYVFVPIIDSWMSKNLGSVILDKPLYLHTTNNSTIYPTTSDGGIIIYTTEQIKKKAENEHYNLYNEKYYKTDGNEVLSKTEEDTSSLMYHLGFKTNTNDRVENDLKIVPAQKSEFDANYGISFWFYLNPQNISTNKNNNKNVRLVNFANRPNIEYNANSNKITLTMIGGKDNMENRPLTIVELENIKLQKWNHMVINYSSGYLDVFIDGVLVASREQVMPNLMSEHIIIGEGNQNGGGINGRITNIGYYSQPIDKVIIDMLYNSNKTTTPPKPGGVIINSKFLFNRLSKVDIIGVVEKLFSKLLGKILPNSSSLDTTSNYLESYFATFPESFNRDLWWYLDKYIFDFEVNEGEVNCNSYYNRSNSACGNKRNKEKTSFNIDLEQRISSYETLS